MGSLVAAALLSQIPILKRKLLGSSFKVGSSVRFSVAGFYEFSMVDTSGARLRDIRSLARVGFRLPGTGEETVSLNA
ncbi:predicted protein [Sclerotinia sclerotiorum 1980 UF-70]|uniref:Uncharacterized protein n=1 Tax=Sclerotinia sclerotiorum (strain ATCC 18683 / 1980 / Ss-1) TaxID=665079 RepID=A7ESQ1_SCLS1|nr:predicted protein [Sclerotinia sclerotiorum 1980 UF-70]EDN92493.1 predicted protein [Sclerotinia sclerotiorum 1980 UF-70]